jgi:TM2 domain-containing membrane protein YozV
MSDTNASRIQSSGRGVSGDAKAMMLFQANRKSTLVAYLFWFFLGGFGAHRFYAGKTGSGIAQIALLLIGFALLAAGVGAILLLALFVWVLIDAFLIPGWISNQNTLLAHSLL